MSICPRNRHSVSRRNKKRAHHARTPKRFVLCKSCGVPKLSHVVCPDCGSYAGRNIHTEPSA